ncbi:Cyclic nucleotide-gated ion channel [Thalictrum thalictroides]|uniref:Cyclic nucleotide-gated ion channel n=1 Tax=Thalictrum thalictroides TaxID=46969 RepID=A0A7J6XG46_THATH|nr:Cyclic nucleotide-gated ion channel [Thalictrum thalictroides]
MLPLPQIVNWVIIPKLANRTAEHANNALSLIVLIQYVPRLFLIFPLNRRIVKNTGVVTKTAWAGAAYNLLLYMLASHVLGAAWYLLSIQRQYGCWSFECRHETNGVCDFKFLDCKSLSDGTISVQRAAWLDVTQVFHKCNATNEDISFNFGIYEDALTSGVHSAIFPEKYLYCLWWGLKNLSSYGQNLATSRFVPETLFCVLICIGGLVLFSHLIGNIQTYLQSMTVRVEEWRVKRRDAEEWMRHRQLPQDLQQRVRRFEQYKWLATRGVDENNILRSLPLDLRRDIQRHLCLGLVCRVPFFAQMDDLLLDAICERLVSSLSTEDTCVVREGDPVNEMIFIIRGQLESSTTNGGRSGFFNSIILRAGDFCGEELLTWALMPNPSQNFPTSTRTVRAQGEVEAFALRAEDLKYVANQFKRLHSKKLQHAFRYYSHQWRTWGGCFIQAAWRRYKKKKLARELAIQEGLCYNGVPNQDEVMEGDEDTGAYSSVVENTNSGQHFGATVLASKFAANTRKGVGQKKKLIDLDGSGLDMPKLFKPDDPDFSETDLG